MDNSLIDGKSIASEDTKTGKGKRILRFCLLLLIMAGILLFVNAFGLANSAFTDPAILSTYNFYSNLIYGCIIGLTVAFTYSLFVTYKDKDYGNGIAFESPGEYPAVSWFKKMSFFQILLLSFIIFAILGLIVFKGTSKQIIFGDVSPIKPEQFTPIGNIIWNNFIVPVSENSGMALLLAIDIIIFWIIARKNNWSKANFRLAVWITGILGTGIYGFFVHLMHYSGQESSLFVVLIFWMIMATLTLLTGSFIPAWMMHTANNLFGDLSTLITSKDLFFYGACVVVALLVVLYLYLYVFKKKKKKFK